LNANQQDFLLYERVLRQQQNDKNNKNKIYSLHEPQVYCMVKGKDHEQNRHYGHALPSILRHVELLGCLDKNPNHQALHFYSHSLFPTACLKKLLFDAFSEGLNRCV